MKKMSRASLTILIVLCFLLMSVSTVMATAKPRPSTRTWKDPVASSVKGGTFTSEVVNSAGLPGTESLASGMLVPAGKNDELQFGGNGIKISSLSAGAKVQICFDFPTYQYSWDGKIAMWNGTKWESMPTTITEKDESYTSACTVAAANGYYSLLIWFYGTPEPVATIRPPD
jgi:hypothetical protein